MSDIKDGGPAFPLLPPDTHSYRERPASGGMSLRDYFAAKALPAVIDAYVKGNGPCIGTEHIVSNAATIAYRFADAMLTRRVQP